MRKKWFQFKTLSFTILSDDVNKDIRRLRIPKLMIPIFVLLFIVVPIALFVYFFQTSKQLETENAHLAKTLDSQTTKANDLTVELNDFKEAETEVRAQLETLYELESEVKESMEDLPVELEPSGGIDIEVSEEEAFQIQADESSLIFQTTGLINRYQNTLDVLEKTSEDMQVIPAKWPVEPNEITSEFGLRTDPFSQTSSFHTGVDIRGNLGDPVYATADGEVTQAEYAGGHGNMIIIRHSDQYETSYAHLSNMDVQVGDQVKKGDIIGTVGSTGRSTGPHLHYEIVEDGKPIDPSTFLFIFDQYEGEK